MDLKSMNINMRKRLRPAIVGLVSLILIGTGSLIFLSKRRDDRASEATAKFSSQEERTRVFLQPPFRPQVIAADGESDERTAGQPSAPPEAFTINCADCHGSHGQGGDVGPRLIGITAKSHRATTDLDKLLAGPRAFGLRSPMPDSFNHLSPEEKRQIIEWLSRL